MGQLCHRLEELVARYRLKHKLTVIQRLALLSLSTRSTVQAIVLLGANKDLRYLMLHTHGVVERTLTETLSHSPHACSQQDGRLLSSYASCRRCGPTQFITRIQRVEGPGHHGYSRSVMEDDVIRIWAAVMNGSTTTPSWVMDWDHPSGDDILLTAGFCFDQS